MSTTTANNPNTPLYFCKAVRASYHAMNAERLQGICGTKFSDAAAFVCFPASEYSYEERSALATEAYNMARGMWAETREEYVNAGF